MSPLNIPGYVIKEKIGSGGMATVYLAVQSSLERLVGLKVMSPALAADPNFSKRFLREARTIASLSHPHIVPIYEVGVTENYLHYFAMQHLPGGDLAARLQRGIDEMELVRVLTAIARALGFAHEHGFVHRDVTPGNILFDKTDNPVLTDFGIARDMSQSTRITNTGVSVGTSQYMSPEQARGGNIDYRSDLYSLGTVCFECLSGRPPYEGVDGFAIAYAHVFEPVPQLEARLVHWQPFIDKALAKDPGERYQGADELISALNELAKSRMGTPQALADYVTRTLVSSVGANAVRFTPPEAQPAVGAAPEEKVTTERKSVAQKPATPLAQAPSDDSATNIGRDRRLWLVPAATMLGLLLIAGVWWWNHARTPSVPAATVAIAVPERGAAEPRRFAPAIPAPTQDDVSSDGSTPTEADPAMGASDAALDPNALAGAPDPTIDEIAPTPEQARADLLAAAALDVRQGRLGLPRGANALERYNQVLSEDPANAEALAGLAAVVDRYLGMAERFRSSDKLEQTAQMIDRAKTVAAGRPELKAALEKSLSLEASINDAFKAPALSALTAKDKPLAQKAFNQWLLFAPSNAEALAGLKEAQAIVIEVREPFDVLKSGGNGPDLVALSLQLNGSERKLEVGVSEVTFKQFEQFLARSGYASRRDGRINCRDQKAAFTFRKRNFREPGFDQASDAPVVCVGFADAQAYAQWLSEQTGKQYRLPSMEEWSAIAAQAVVVGPPSCARGNLADLSLARSEASISHLACDDKFPATAPVRAFGGSAAGLFGAVGNAREWVSNCAKSASGSCVERIAAGTGWASGPTEDLLNERRSLRADAAANDVGFRIVREY